MAIQNRYGDFSQFRPEKMVTSEIAVVTSGDPNAESGRSVYVCFIPGAVKRITTYEDFEAEFEKLSEEMQNQFTDDITDAIQQALSATEAANAATEAAQTAAEAANEAAEAAKDYVLGDISEKTVTFETAAQRAGIESGDSLSVAFGKLAKFCADLDQHAFNPLANNLTTNTAGYGLDARQGKTLKTEIDQLNTNIVNIGNQVNTGIYMANDNIDNLLPGNYWVNGYSSSISGDIPFTNMHYMLVSSGTAERSYAQVAIPMDNTAGKKGRIYSGGKWSKWI
ncbi:hypothetical protein [Bacteroides acidifaciens]|uniref:hypothetical protein n=1 Tax=Bacteroides acidifaciens TaxID=85831 RepID=UPI0025AF48B9|nr:hypothetical protein [Bacteroides acidifaciens]